MERLQQATTGTGHFRKACGLPNLTPAPKLNRYAESVVLNFLS
jgi:hypothetical protein